MKNIFASRTYPIEVILKVVVFTLSAFALWNIADMFIGYALMLFEGGIAPDVTDEALQAYKKAFTEAYDYYSVEFIINRAN